MHAHLFGNGKVAVGRAAGRALYENAHEKGKHYLEVDYLLEMPNDADSLALQAALVRLGATFQALRRDESEIHEFVR